MASENDLQQIHDRMDAAVQKTVPLTWGLFGVAKDFGIVVVLIWYLWFSQTTTMPNLQREFHELIAKEREAFRVELKIQRDHDEKRNIEIARAMTELVSEIRAWKRSAN